MKLSEHIKDVIISSDTLIALDTNNNALVDVASFVVLALRFLENYNAVKHSDRDIELTSKYVENINAAKLLDILKDREDFTEDVQNRYTELLKEYLFTSTIFTITTQSRISDGSDCYFDKKLFYYKAGVFASRITKYTVNDERSGKNLLNITIAYVGARMKAALSETIGTKLSIEYFLPADEDIPKISVELFKELFEVPSPSFIVEKNSYKYTVTVDNYMTATEHIYRVRRPFRLEGLNAGEKSYYDFIEWCMADISRLFANVTSESSISG